MRNKLFSLLLVVLFILGIGILIKPQNEISKNEKRYLSEVEDINSVESFESTLSDQFYFRDNLSTLYYKVKLSLNNVSYKILSKITNSSYKYLDKDVIDLNDGYLINDVLYYDENKMNVCISRAYNLTEVNNKYPNIKMYVYFPTTLEEVLLFGDNDGLEYRNEFLKHLNENIKTSSLDVGDKDKYEEYYYKSDFHWNGYGAYQGYKDIISLIAEDFKIDSPKEIEEELVYEYLWSGNISGQIGGLGEKDNIIDLKLNNIGEYRYYINGIETDYNKIKEDYALYGNNTGYSDYDVYFGDNSYERRFEFGDSEKPNLLVFCDSMTNVNQEWIASHFNTTIYIDLRANDGSFNLDDYINKYDIDAILICQRYSNLYFNGDMYIPID